MKINNKKVLLVLLTGFFWPVYGMDELKVSKEELPSALKKITNPQSQLQLIDEKISEEIKNSFKRPHEQTVLDTIMRDINSQQVQNSNTQDSRGIARVHIAAMFDNPEILTLLADQNADLKIRDNAGATPLHYAAMRNKPDAIRFLLSKGVDKDAKLLVKNPDPDDVYEESKPIHVAALYNSLDALKALVDAEASVSSFDAFYDEPLHYAFFEKEFPFCFCGSSSDFQACSDLFSPENTDKAALVDFLLRKGVNINVAGSNQNTALHIAAKQNNLEDITFLLSRGASVELKNRYGQTALLRVVSSSDDPIEAVSILLHAGSDINAVEDEFGNTALHTAIKNTKAEVVELLLERDADKTIENKEGLTAVDVLYQYPYAPMVNLFLKEGLAVNAQNKKGETLLFAAALYNQPETVNLLLEKFADQTIPDTEGDLPLYAAIDLGHDDVVKTFVRHNINLELINNQDMTPLEYAVSKYFSLDDDESNLILPSIYILLDAGAAMGRNGADFVDRNRYVATHDQRVELVELAFAQERAKRADEFLGKEISIKDKAVFLEDELEMGELELGKMIAEHIRSYRHERLKKLQVHAQEYYEQ